MSPFPSVARPQWTLTSDPSPLAWATSTRPQLAANNLIAWRTGRRYYAGGGVKSAVSTISLFLLYLLNYVAAYCRVDNDKLLCVELSVEMRVSLEDEKTAMEKQLTDEYTQLKLELDTIREKKKDVETKLENQQQTSTQQMDRQRQGSCWPYHSLREFGFTFLYSDFNWIDLESWKTKLNRTKLEIKRYPQNRKQITYTERHQISWN